MTAILAIVPGWPAVGEALRSTNAPAWVQAITSSVALAIALVVVFLQHSLATRDANANQRAITLARLASVFSCAIASKAMLSLFMDVKHPAIWRDHVLPVVDELLLELRELDLVGLSPRIALDAVIARRTLIMLRSGCLNHAEGIIDADGIQQFANNVIGALDRLTASASADFNAMATANERAEYMRGFIGVQVESVKKQG